MATTLARLAGGLLAVATLFIRVAPVAAQPPGAWESSAWHLWRVDVDGSNLKLVDGTPNDRCGSPDWSPDGEFIAYDVLSTPGEGYEIAVIRADGSDRRLIGPGSIPSWSPDGKLIVCQSGGMVVMKPDGTGRETIFPNGFSLRWSPRGNRIASSSGNGIWLFDLATGRTRMIFSIRDGLTHGFGISSDGRRFCFSTRARFAGSGATGLGLATLDEQSMQASVRWLVTEGYCYHASWSPDGRRVVFAWQPADKLVQLYTLDVDSNEPPKLLPGLDTSHHNVNPDWSPDGKTIVFSSPAPLVP